MKELIILMFTVCTLHESPAFASCDKDSKPENYSGRFQILKSEKAKLRCDQDWNTDKRFDPPEYIEAKGCYIDLKVIGDGRIKDKYGSSILQIYAYGPLCDKKIGEKLPLHIGKHGCCENRLFYGCEKKEEVLKALGGNPQSPYDMECMGGRWVVYEDIYPK